MKRLWIADVHANLPAFETVLAAAGTVDEVIFLGDIVGFGPHPGACLDLLMDLRPQAVIGNHDAAVLATSPDDPPGEPQSWDAWTRRQLRGPQLDFLAAMPEVIAVSVGGVQATLRHHLPGAPYLHPAMPDDVLAAYVAERRESLTICGHSHRALDRTLGGQRLVCLPPVGQPRNGDPRAGYALEEDGVLSFHVIPYDVERSVRDTLAIGLPEPFLTRWVRFVRTAADPEWSREYGRGG